MVIVLLDSTLKVLPYPHPTTHPAFHKGPQHSKHTYQKEFSHLKSASITGFSGSINHGITGACGVCSSLLLQRAYQPHHGELGGYCWCTHSFDTAPKSHTGPGHAERPCPFKISTTGNGHQSSTRQNSCYQPTSRGHMKGAAPCCLNPPLFHSFAAFVWLFPLPSSVVSYLKRLCSLCSSTHPNTVDDCAINSRHNFKLSLFSSLTFYKTYLKSPFKLQVLPCKSHSENTIVPCHLFPQLSLRCWQTILNKQPDSKEDCATLSRAAGRFAFMFPRILGGHWRLNGTVMSEDQAWWWQVNSDATEWRCADFILLQINGKWGHSLIRRCWEMSKKRQSSEQWLVLLLFNQRAMIRHVLFLLSGSQVFAICTDKHGLIYFPISRIKDYHFWLRKF